MAHYLNEVKEKRNVRIRKGTCPNNRIVPGLHPIFRGHLLLERIVMLNEIFNEVLEMNAVERARLKAEAARLKAEAAQAKKAWRQECEKLAPSLLSQAVNKATTWLRVNLIMRQELLGVEECENGLVLHITMEDGNDEKREWEVPFRFFFKGDTPDDISVRWSQVELTRDYMEHYYVSASDW